ncbi:hypothetical protein QMK33_02615 [Hymenobacter sp. H14-R3]|uniref:hypothetical protein n=1 Tax=Hymenobacter sp. H14-R3 TaxID=3046308 RepID=UPI0024BAB75F|nr:hypothetical protein [Hymenobacter sp. H14-R3]MDJ0364030.1 hypothetical protein [Hymenobacter sp. H14-R3]
MNFSVFTFVPVCLGLAYWWYQYTKKSANTIEKSGYHAWAIFRSYRKDYVRVAGSWHCLDYPYVEYKSAEGEMVFERLKYAESNGRLLEIGDEIEVVRYDEILYYRAALHPNYEWSYVLWLAATVGALAALGGLANYFTKNK